MHTPCLMLSFPRPFLQPVKVMLSPDLVLHCTCSPVQLSASKFSKHNLSSIKQSVVKKWIEASQGQDIQNSFGEPKVANN